MKIKLLKGCIKYAKNNGFGFSGIDGIFRCGMWEN